MSDLETSSSEQDDFECEEDELHEDCFVLLKVAGALLTAGLLGLIKYLLGWPVIWTMLGFACAAGTVFTDLYLKEILQ